MESRRVFSWLTWNSLIIQIFTGNFWEENPMLGPHFHRLDQFGAKNAVKLSAGERWEFRGNLEVSG